MKRHLLSAAALAFFTPFLLHAQPSPDPSAVPQAHEPAEETRFNLQFPGGSFSDLIQSIANEIGRPPNIIAGIHARELEVPPFDLYSVTVDDVLTALNNIWAVSAGNYHPYKTPDGIWTFEIRRSAGDPDDPFAERSGVAAEPTPARQFTRTIRLALVLERYRIDDVITAIETAWEMAGETEGVLRYHQETRLLFVRGTPEQISLVENVMEELQYIPEPPELRAARAHLRELLSIGVNPEYPAVRELLEEIRRLERGGAGSDPADSE